MLDLKATLALLQIVAAAATTVCDVIDKAQAHKLTHEAQQSLKVLRKAVESLKPDVVMTKVLTNVMGDDKRFIQRQDGKDALEYLQKALQSTRRLLEGNRSDEAAMNPSGSEEPRKTFKVVFHVLSFNDLLRQRLQFLDDLKDATYELNLYQQNNKRAFKLVWYLYVVAQQHTSRYFPVPNIEDHIEQALNSVLHAFHVYPFAVSAEGDGQVNLPTLTVLNDDHDVVKRYEQLARQIGKTWVNDHVGRDKAQVQAQDLGALQASLFELLWSGTVERLKRSSAYSADGAEQSEFEKTVEGLENMLQEVMVRSKKQHLAIAFCGMAKAGKSLLLNALIGRAILPSDELRSTACPCRLRHVEGQNLPELRFQAEPFLVALKELQAHQYGRKMSTYQPAPENVFEALRSDVLSEPSEEEVLHRTIYSKWIDMDDIICGNLLRFENPDFRLARMATGELDVKTLLGQLNDIARLCQRFGFKFDMSDADWPLITVEFSSLRGHRVDCVFEFIDLPGIGEDFNDSNFESLVRLVASDSDAIVPVVSFTELSSSDWRRLPGLVASGFNRKVSVVVCTHLDQVSRENMDEQLKTVTKTFWPKDPLNTNRVIPCSTLMGLSARDLLDRSDVSKPPFETIWDNNTTGYHCAARILGVGDPQSTYHRFDIRLWRHKLKEELQASGIPWAIPMLTKEMVVSARINALLSDADTVIRQMRDISNVYARKLLEARCIKIEYDAAKRSYDQAHEMHQAVLGTCDRINSMQAEEIRLLLERELGMISQKAGGLINRRIEKTWKDWTVGGISLEDVGISHGTRAASNGNGFGGVQLEDGDINRNSQESSSAETRCGKILITETKTRAEDFLRLSQHDLTSALVSLNQEYTVIILELAHTTKAKLLKALRGIARQVELQSIPEGWDNRDPEPPNLNVELTFQEIRGVIHSRQLSFFNRQYTIEIDTFHDLFKDQVIDPWIRKLKEEGEKCLLRTTETSLNAARHLMTSAFFEREDRCKRELEGKDKPADEGRVRPLVVMYGNLLAAEEALRELFVRVEALRTRSGQ